MKHQHHHEKYDPKQHDLNIDRFHQNHQRNHQYQLNHIDKREIIPIQQHQIVEMLQQDQQNQDDIMMQNHQKKIRDLEDKQKEVNIIENPGK